METTFPYTAFIPFSGLSGKPFWILNQTATVSMQSLFFDVNNLPKADCDGYNQIPPYYPNWENFAGSQCFVASFNGSCPLSKGPKGIYCSNDDFYGLYNHQCSINSNPCSVARNAPYATCQTTLKAELTAKFGRILGPSDGRDGQGK